MSVDPTADLFKAVGDALLADTFLANLVGTRVYSEWATKGDLPLIRMRIPNVDRFDDDCGDGAETEINVHLYTRGGPVQRSQMAERVRAVLHDSQLALDNATVRNTDHVRTINLTDPSDPTVSSAVVRFTTITIVEA